MTLTRLGWDAHFSEAHERHAPPGAVPARVTRVDRTLVRVHDGRAEHTARAPRDLDPPPAVGDWVALARDAVGPVVRAVLPRLTALARRKPGEDAARAQVLAANVDVAVLVMALDADFNVRRLERYLALVHESGARALIVLNKADACTRVAERVRAARDAVGDAPVIVASAVTGAGVRDVATHLRDGVTGVLLGSSGVGKSTLANRLLGADALTTGAVREGDGKGRHTTTHRELVLLPAGGVLVDTPGLRELAPWVTEGAVDATFADVAELSRGCRFKDCAHDAEPGCAVKAALADGRLDAARLESHRKLQREAARLELDKREARALARSWGKRGKAAQAGKRARRGWE